MAKVVKNRLIRHIKQCWGIGFLLPAILLQGCYAGQGIGLKEPIQNESGLMAPNRPFIHMPRGEDSYSAGVRDGCQTYMGIMGSSTLRQLETKIDGYRLSDDPDYLRGYVDGGEYCTFALDWDTH